MQRFFLAAIGAIALAGCSTLTVEAGLSQQVSGDWKVHAQGGEDVTHRPRARIALGFTPALSRSVSASLSIEHLSYPGANDRGEERLHAELRWQPFASAP